MKFYADLGAAHCGCVSALNRGSFRNQPQSEPVAPGACSPIPERLPLTPRWPFSFMKTSANFMNGSFPSRFQGHNAAAAWRPYRFSLSHLCTFHIRFQRGRKYVFRARFLSVKYNSLRFMPAFWAFGHLGVAFKASLMEN